MTNMTVNPAILKTVPLFALLSDHQLAALFPAIQHRSYPRHSFMLRAGEKADALYIIMAGRAKVVVDDGEGREVTLTLIGPNEFFGEMSLLSGRPRLERAIAGAGCILVETPRRTMLKLMNSNEEVRSGVDWIFIVREMQRHFAPYATLRELRNIASRITLRKLKAGEVLFNEGDAGDSLFVVRSGAITLLRRQGKQDQLVSQVRSGQLIGEMALMGDPVRRETATANVAAELIEIKRKEFLELTRREDARLDPLQKDVSRRVVDNARMQVRPEAGTVMNFLMQEGLGEALLRHSDRPATNTHRGPERDVHWIRRLG